VQAGFVNWLSRRAVLVVVSLAPLITVPSAIAAAGGPEASFGTEGHVSFGLSFKGEKQLGEPATIMFGPAGTIELAGTASPPFGGEWRLFAARLSENGGLDPTFASSGSTVTSPVPAYEYGVLQDWSGKAAVLEPDGAIVIVGRRTQLRLTSGGQIDPAFQNGNSPLDLNALIQLPGGDQLAGGENPTEQGTDYAVLQRLLPDGAPDDSFGEQGTVTLPAGPGPEPRQSISAMVPLADGETLLAGSGVSYANTRQGEEYAWLAEVNSSGALNQSFGTRGLDYIPTTLSPDGNVLLIREPSGLIAVASAHKISEEQWQATVWGFAHNGSPDTSFGNGGAAQIPILEAGDRTTADGLTTDSHGYIYVGVDREGTSSPYNRGSYVARLTPAGQMDPTFGQSGVSSLPAHSGISALAIDPAGRLLIGGGVEQSVYVERLSAADPPYAPTPPAVGKPSTAAGGHSDAAAKRVVRCRPIDRAKHERMLSCTLTLGKMRRSWSSLVVVVSRHGHRIAKRTLEHIRLPVSIELTIPDTKSTLRWTVTLKRGRQRTELIRNVIP
jgi:uncharacterized delta-60 repeat protein